MTTTTTKTRTTTKARGTTKARTGPAVTRRGQEGGFTAAAMVAALETAWAAIREHQPELPAAVIIVASGTSGRHAKWGHYAAMRWQHGTDQLPEVLVSGEGLKRPATEVLTTLLHEAAHALADVRGIKDTSRQGRWYNGRFAALADELGLDVRKDPSIGFSSCTLRDQTAKDYAAPLKQLSAALSAYRHPEIRDAGTTKSNNALACTCQCPRRIRVARAVLEVGDIVCTVCDAPFHPDEDAA
jgi:hypothetical protein